MKALISAFSTMVIFFLLFYLLGCFVQNSFNISNWTDTARSLIGCMGGLTSIVLGLLIGKVVAEENNN